MSTLTVTNIRSYTANTPPFIADSAGTEVGEFCRAWVNFNGTGTVAIRASFNVSSITDNGTGDYTVNFTNAMSDANYSRIATVGNSTQTLWNFDRAGASTASFCRISTFTRNDGGVEDVTVMSVAIFR